MKHRRTSLLLILCTGLSLGNAVAGPVMEFKTTRVHVDATPEMNEVPAVFKFKNTGDEPLKIADLEVGCKCLHATSEKAEYQPGEEGEIKTLMEIGAVEGVVSKSVTVISNDSKNPQLALAVEIAVPNVIVFDPPVTTWQVGDALTPRKISVKMATKDPINIKGLSSTRDNFDAQIKVIQAGREYEITLTPESTDTPALGMLTVETDCKIAKYTKRQTFFNVVRKVTIGDKLPPSNKQAAPTPAPSPAPAPAPTAPTAK